MPAFEQYEDEYEKLANACFAWDETYQKYLDGTLWEERAGQFPTHVQDVYVDNVYLAAVNEDIKFEKPFAVECLADDAVHVDRITLNNITAKNGNPDKALLTIEDTTRVKEVNMNGIRLEGFGKTVKGNCQSLNTFDIKR